MGYFKGRTHTTTLNSGPSGPFVVCLAVGTGMDGNGARTELDTQRAGELSEERRGSGAPGPGVLGWRFYFTSK